MGIGERLGHWFQIIKVQPTEESASIAGGREGELQLKEMIGASFAFKDAHLLGGRRVRSKSQGRRREIDLIVCTPRMIHLVEVKNWSGHLAVRDGDWRQTRRGGDVVEHGDLIATNLLKRDAVVEYLGERGVTLDEPFLRGHIAPKVIFMNPNLVLEPAIEGLPEVISRRELDEYLGSRPEGKWTERLFASLVEYLLDAESKPVATSSRAPSGRIPPDQYGRIVTFLSETGTWDQLHFYGTEVVTGDVIGLQLGPKSYRRPEVVETAGLLPIRLEWSRGRLIGLLKAITGLGSLGSVYLGKARMKALPADTVTFHVVGEKEPSTFKLVEIAQIVLG